MKFFKQIVAYATESVAELKKVTWPTREETIKHTILVISISLLIALFLGLLDYGLGLAVENYIIQ